MIDFSKFEKPEGITDEMLANPVLLKFINEHVETTKTAAVSQAVAERDKAVTAKAIADQKVEELNEKLKEASKPSADDGEEVRKLKAQLASAKEDAQVEANAKIEALQAQLNETSETNTKLKGDLDRSEVTSFLNKALSDYNAKNPTVKVVAGAEQYLIDAGLGAFRKTEDGSIRAFDGETPLTGSEGFITGPEFIARLRDDPSKQLFFEKPAGGGAAGGKGGGAANPGAMGGTTKERAQALSNKFPDLPMQ